MTTKLGTGGTGYPVIFEQMWAAHEAFRRLKFPPESIFVRPDANGGNTVFVTLRHGGREFNIEIGHRSRQDSLEKFCAQWGDFIAALTAHRISEELLHGIYSEWLGRNGGGIALLRALENKGFSVLGTAQDLN